jgi:hypothetical protein
VDRIAAAAKADKRAMQDDFGDRTSISPSSSNAPWWTSPAGAATCRSTKPDPARCLDIGMVEHLLSHPATVCL